MDYSESSLKDLSNDSELLYESVPELSESSMPKINSNLSNISELVADTKQKQEESFELAKSATHRSNKQKKIVERVEQIDDLIRNFLIKNGLTDTLTIFQQEFYELKIKQNGLLSVADSLPDIYLLNQKLEKQVSELQKELDSSKLQINKTKDMFDKLKKEKDYNKLHYSRVQHEKEKLLKDIDRFKSLQVYQEQIFQEITCKYESCMKDKMLLKLEKDRGLVKLESMQKHIDSLELKLREAEGRNTLGHSGAFKNGASSESQSKLIMDGPKENKPLNKSSNSNSLRKQRVNSQISIIPPPIENPFKSADVEPMFKKTLTLAKTFKGHMASISRCKVHPKKPFLATASDDKTWKVWSLAKGDFIMSGEGHLDWISDVVFHPRGTHIATCSGDCTVKVWDLANVACAYTFKDHAQPVWSLSFHNSGDFLVAGAMDHSCKMYDVPYGKIRYNFKDHTDSVNCVAFSAFDNWFISGSSDKTLSMWDIRTCVPTSTLYGHLGSVNSFAFTPDETKLTSVDTEGVVHFWDLRTMKHIGEIETNRYALNGVAIDAGGRLCFAASEDNSIKAINLDTLKIEYELKGHEDSVLDLAINPLNKELISCSADSTFRIWS